MYPVLSQNRLKFFQKLNQKKYRDPESLFIISGLRAIKGIYDNNPDVIETLIVADDKTDLIKDLNNLKHRIDIFTVSAKSFPALVDEKSPQGICAVARRPNTRFADSTLMNGPLIFLDRINDPGNLGTIIRSAVWFGFRGILLSPYSADPYQPKAVRSSAGTLTAIPLAEDVKIGDLESLKKKGYKIFSTSSHTGNNPADIQFPDNSLIIFGSEAHGLQPALTQIADQSLTIPGTGSAESLNLAIAAAIIMYQVRLNS